MGRRITVLVHDDGGGDAAALAAGLAQAELHLLPWPDPPAPPDPAWGFDAALVCGAVPDAIAALRAAAPKTPVVAISDNPADGEAADAWLRPPASALQVAARIRALTRLAAMEDVAARRGGAARRAGATVPLNDEPALRPAVLFVGPATPHFMAVRAALAGAGTEVVAAFSSYSAFDYLHERAFDAVVLNAIDKRDFAFTISSAMRRNSRLYHTPVLLLAPPGGRGDSDEAFARGVSDLLPAGAPQDEIRDRVLTLAAERQRRRAARNVLESCRDARILDVASGLYAARFAAAHLQDLLAAARRPGASPVSLILMRLKGPEPAVSAAALAAARRQFAAMLRHLLRAEDLPALIDDSLFAAILPHTGAAGAGCVADRIRAIADCTAFEGDDPLKPFRLRISTAAVEAAGEEVAEALIERALRALEGARQAAG